MKLSNEKVDVAELVQFPAGRKRLIELMAGGDNNWQNAHTPWKFTREMVETVSLDEEHVVVFCSLEFLEVLIKEKGYLAERVLYVADSEEDELFAQAVYDCSTVLISPTDIIGADDINFRVLGKKIQAAVERLGVP